MELGLSLGYDTRKSFSFVEKSHNSNNTNNKSAVLGIEDLVFCMTLGNNNNNKDNQGLGVNIHSCDYDNESNNNNNNKKGRFSASNIQLDLLPAFSREPDVHHQQQQHMMKQLINMQPNSSFHNNNKLNIPSRPAANTTWQQLRHDDHKLCEGGGAGMLEVMNNKRRRKAGGDDDKSEIQLQTVGISSSSFSSPAPTNSILSCFQIFPAPSSTSTAKGKSDHFQLGNTLIHNNKEHVDHDEEAATAAAADRGTCNSNNNNSRGSINCDDELFHENNVCAAAAARKKLRLSKDQSAFLELSFKDHNTLNPNQKLALAKQLNLRPRQVEVWFQNRRARTKLKQTEVDCEELKRCCDTLTEENKRLQKELQELRSLKANSDHPFYLQLPPTTLTMCPSCATTTTTAAKITPHNILSLSPNSQQSP